MSSAFVVAVVAVVAVGSVVVAAAAVPVFAAVGVDDFAVELMCFGIESVVVVVVVEADSCVESFCCSIYSPTLSSVQLNAQSAEMKTVAAVGCLSAVAFHQT